MKAEKKYTPLSVEPFLLNAEQLSVLMSVSKSHLLALDKAGKLPQAVSLGKSRRWITSEVKAFCDAGCPSRIEWQRLRFIK